MRCGCSERRLWFLIFSLPEPSFDILNMASWVLYQTPDVLEWGMWCKRMQGSVIHWSCSLHSPCLRKPYVIIHRSIFVLHPQFLPFNHPHVIRALIAPPVAFWICSFLPVLYEVQIKQSQSLTTKIMNTMAHICF